MYSTFSKNAEKVNATDSNVALNYTENNSQVSKIPQFNKFLERETQLFQLSQEIFINGTKKTELYDYCQIEKKDGNDLQNNIVYLNFENDETFFPLFQLSETYNKFYQELYSECEINYDIEITELHYNNEIPRNKLRHFLFVHCGKTDIGHKKMFECQYFPAFINKCLSDIKIQEIEKKMCKKEGYNSIQENTTFDKKKIIEKMKITIPTFIEKKILLPHKTITTDKSNMIPINDYNNLENSFTSKYSYYGNVENDTDNKNNKIVSVLFNYNELYTIVKEYKKSGDLSDFQFTTKVLNECPEYGFIELLQYDTLDNSMISQIKCMFHKKSFADVNELNEQLGVLEKFYNFLVETLKPTVVSNNDEETVVRNIILSHYDIDDNIENRMKANQLIDSVINLQRNGPLIYPFETDNNSFRIRISKYLIKIGLKKHRYSDGYYYYGIKRKIISNEINQDELSKIIEKRKDELQSFTK